MRLKKRGNFFTPPRDVANYELLAVQERYSWIGDFLIRHELQGKLRALVEEEKRITGLLLLKKDFLSHLRESYGKIVARRAEGLETFLVGQRNNPDPLVHFQQRACRKTHFEKCFLFKKR